ncbi:MAG: hypothetical protein LBI53_04300 [Candidatus Peribacteria bacterium]|nr:hypothetical protein [Candidatus Peribacteria bacterium]
MYFYDLVENEGSTAIEINWIDSTPPSCIIEYDPNIITHQNVIATLT